MPSRTAHSRFDDALASRDPYASLEALVRSRIAAGAGHIRVCRQLSCYHSRIDPADPRLGPVEQMLDRVWGASWALGLDLFKRPLDQAKSAAARAEPFSVDEVVAALRPLNNRPVRVLGVLEKRFERSSIEQYPPNERTSYHESSLWASFAYHCSWRTSDASGVRENAGGPRSWTRREANERWREIGMWIRDEFCTSLSW